METLGKLIFLASYCNFAESGDVYQNLNHMLSITVKAILKAIIIIRNISIVLCLCYYSGIL